MPSRATNTSLSSQLEQLLPAELDLLVEPAGARQHGQRPQATLQLRLLQQGGLGFTTTYLHRALRALEHQRNASKGVLSPCPHPRRAETAQPQQAIAQ